MDVSPVRYFEVDRNGFIGICGSLSEMNARLEWSDVREDRYVVIDSEGWLYDYRPDDENCWGYRWERSDRYDIDLKVILQSYAHGEQLTVDELNFVR